MYNPYSFQALGLQQPVPPQQFQFVGQSQQLIKVSGLDGAKAYQLGPNSAVALFHESEDLFYVKTTDGAGFPTIKTFRFEPFEVSQEETPKYVTVDEFEKFKQEVLNGK